MVYYFFWANCQTSLFHQSAVFQDIPVLSQTSAHLFLEVGMDQIWSPSWYIVPAAQNVIVEDQDVLFGIRSFSNIKINLIYFIHKI